MMLTGTIVNAAGVILDGVAGLPGIKHLNLMNYIPAMFMPIMICLFM